MSILVKKSTEAKITYSYEIKTDTGVYPHPYLAPLMVKIVFINRKFKSCSYPFRGTYTRDNWEILETINREITKIEETFAKARNVVDGL